MTHSATRHARLSVLLLVASSLCAAPAAAQSRGHGRGASSNATEATKASSADTSSDDARTHFERGMKLYADGAYDSALAEFKQSLVLMSTLAAMQNTGLTLKKLKRFDEAAEMFDRLLATYPNLSESDRAFVTNERRELNALVGTLEVRVVEPDATIMVDGIERGKSPLNKPLRVSAGERFVRVTKEGYVPFEQRIDVAGRTNVVINAKLGALTRGGRLRVTEESGVEVEVLVDNVRVGRAPWEGTLPVGKHVVALRGENDLGSPPAEVDVELNQLAKLSLAVEPLNCALRVEPTPITSRVAIDGVDVGQGIWDDRLRCGGHLVEIAAPGFLSSKRQVSLLESKPGKVVEQLERDPNSSEYKLQNPPRVTLDLRAGLAIAPSIAGSASSSCGEGCSSGLGLGGLGQLRIGYQLSSGIGFAFDAGFLYLRQRVANYESEIKPNGLSPQRGLASDSLFMRGPLLGGSVAIQRGSKVVLMGRLGAGVMISAWKVNRGGIYQTSTGTAYQVPSQTGNVLSDSGIAAAPYINPEFRVGYRLNKTWIVDAGVQAMLLFGMQSARWSSEAEDRFSPRCEGAGCPGESSFNNASLFKSTIFTVLPFLGTRAEF